MDKQVAHASIGFAAGVLGARVLDEAMPDTKLYTINLGPGREAVIRPSTVLGFAAIAASLIGVKLPTAVLGAGVGMVSYEAVMEVGDDLTAKVLGLPAPGAAPNPGLPAPPPAAPAAFYPYQAGGVPDWTLNAAMNGLQNQFG